MEDAILEATIEKELQRVEWEAWDCAERLGIQKTQENGDRFARIFSGLVNCDATRNPGFAEENPELFKKLHEQYQVEAVKEYEGASTNEVAIAFCFLGASMIRRGIERKEMDEYVGLLCELYHTLGGLYVATGGKTNMTLDKIFSRLGTSGAISRHASMTQLKDWAVDLYRAGNWVSANKAAHELKDKVMEHGRTINVKTPLTEENAQRTIADWFRKSV